MAGAGQFDLAAVTRRDPWATATTSIAQIRSQARQLGWVEVPTRKGEGPVSELRPRTPEQANPKSLSALHGLGEQPLHTDGAHLLEPPDMLVLFSAEPNETATLLWSPSSPLTNPKYPLYSLPEALMGGIFLVRSGTDQFLATARTHEHGFRYDPGCMTPHDERARAAVEYFQDAQARAYRHEWTEPRQALFIKNRNVLHARAAVSETDGNRLLTRIAYQTKVDR